MLILLLDTVCRLQAFWSQHLRLFQPRKEDLQKKSFWLPPDIRAYDLNTSRWASGYGV